MEKEYSNIVLQFPLLLSSISLAAHLKLKHGSSAVNHKVKSLLRCLGNEKPTRLRRVEVKHPKAIALLLSESGGKVNIRTINNVVCIITPYATALYVLQDKCSGYISMSSDPKFPTLILRYKLTIYFGTKVEN
jgi:hypothetical protein